MKRKIFRCENRQRREGGVDVKATSRMRVDVNGCELM